MDISINYASIFKAISDETRLRIVEMLSCGEMCACDILEYFQITQPTLSYHMKILTDSGLVMSRKEGTWIRYKNNEDLLKTLQSYWTKLIEGDESCICHQMKDVSNTCKISAL